MPSTVRQNISGMQSMRLGQNSKNCTISGRRRSKSRTHAGRGLPAISFRCRHLASATAASATPTPQLQSADIFPQRKSRSFSRSVLQPVLQRPTFSGWIDGVVVVSWPSLGGRGRAGRRCLAAISILTGEAEDTFTFSPTQLVG